MHTIKAWPDNPTPSTVYASIPKCHILRRRPHYIWAVQTLLRLTSPSRNRMLPINDQGINHNLDGRQLLDGPLRGTRSTLR
mmetsp:Transcript_12696/g.27516  ORF Transcript_12696/g.27516 Transcript_12696/m.27516 type:complete len:81 (-) Transcript_12696:2378-2620(-)